jgi:hypothetical protein
VLRQRQKHYASAARAGPDIGGAPLYACRMSGARLPVDLEPDAVIDAYKRDVDRTLLRENLRRTVEERLVRLMEQQRFAEELRRAGREASAPKP